MSIADCAQYVFSPIRNDDATVMSGADEAPCSLRWRDYPVTLDQQLVSVCIDSESDVVGGDEALARGREGRDSVSQVIRLEGRNDTGLPLSIPSKPERADSWEGFILASCYAVLRRSVNEC